MQRVRLFCELKPKETADAGDPAVAAFLVIQESQVNAILIRYNPEGILLNETTHRNVPAAKAAAEAEFSDQITPWQPFPAGVASIANLVDERMRERLASGDTDSNRTLRYHRPRASERVAGPRDSFGEEVISCFAMLLSFACICYVVQFRGYTVPVPIGVPLIAGAVSPSLWRGAESAVEDVVLLATLGSIASTLMWKYRVSHVLIGHISATLLSVVAGAIVVGLWVVGSGMGALVPPLTAIPFFLAVRNRVKRLRAVWRVRASADDQWES